MVRTAAGPVAVDPTGKQNGRGAYLCRQQSCWQLAFKRKSLNHALETTLGAEELTTLARFSETLPEKLPAGQAEPGPTEPALTGPTSPAS